MQNQNNAVNLAKKWENRLLKAQMGHYCQAENLGRRASWIGGLIIFLTVGITAVTFYEPTPSTKYFIQWAFRAAGILVTILSAIQTFYKPSERAEIHRAQASRYGSLKRKVEIAISCSNDSDKQLCNELDNVVKEWEGIALDSPLTNFKTLKEIEKKKKELADSCATP